MTSSIAINNMHDFGYAVPGCSRRELLRVANRVHKIAGYKGDRPFPILKLVEQIFPLVYDDYDFIVVEEKELGDIFGETYPDNHIMKIRSDVYDAAYIDNPFARSTIAHECAHQILHEGLPLSLARQEGGNLPAYNNPEWQANALAGALLMPADKILHCTPEQICATYKVTASAAKTQLKAILRETHKGAIPLL